MEQKAFIFLFILISILMFSSTQTNFKVYQSWDTLVIDANGREHDCPDCIPYKVKISSNKGKLYLSIPRIYNKDIYDIDQYNVTATFIILMTDLPYMKYWQPWPSDQYAIPPSPKDKQEQLKFYSIMGFEIDNSQNIYLLDQGIILKENNTIMYNTSKLMIFDKDGKEKKIYFFDELDFTTAFLTDIVVDQSKKYAYITDSGILLNNQSIPRIIVIDLENEKIYKILNNNINFKPDENISIAYSENEMYNYFTNITGLNNIQITCDGEMIFFSSLKSKMLYTVSTKDISDAINNYIKTKEENYLNNIKINIVNKNLISQSFLLTSKNNIFMTNMDKGSIRISYSFDQNNLLKHNFNDFSEFKPEKIMVNWPSSVDIYNGILYLLDNNYHNRHNQKNETNKAYYNNGLNDEGDEEENETVILHAIYTANVTNDEYSYKKGCSIYIFKLNIFTIFILSWFGIILIIVIFLMIIVNMDTSNKKTKKQIEDENNVNELNRRLNE
jgi:hypothetical protein